MRARHGAMCSGHSNKSGIRAASVVVNHVVVCRTRSTATIRIYPNTFEAILNKTSDHPNRLSSYPDTNQDSENITIQTTLRNIVTGLHPWQTNQAFQVHPHQGSFQETREEPHHLSER